MSDCYVQQEEEDPEKSSLKITSLDFSFSFSQ